MVVDVAALPDPGRAATAMATTPSPNMIRVIVPMNSADNSPQRPCRPNVCRPAPCIGWYSSAMPNPPIDPSDNLAHQWKTGGAPAPVARHSPHASAPPFANLRPSPEGGWGSAGPGRVGHYPVP